MSQSRINQNRQKLYEEAKKEFNNKYDDLKLRPLNTETLYDYIEQENPQEWIKTSDIETEIDKSRITYLLNVLESENYLDEPLGKSYPINSDLEKGAEKLMIYSCDVYEKRLENSLNRGGRLEELQKIDKIPEIYQNLLKDLEKQSQKPLSNRENISKNRYRNLIEHQETPVAVNYLLKTLEDTGFVKEKANNKFQVIGNHLEYQINEEYFQDRIK